jgi:hypothetical protein
VLYSFDFILDSQFQFWIVRLKAVGDDSVIIIEIRVEL